MVGLVVAVTGLLVLATGAAAVPVSLIQQGEKLTVGEESGAGLAGWNVAVSADGNTALIGGPGDGGDIGAAWVFTRSGGVWTQQGPKLTAAGESAKGGFGVSVALSGDGNIAFIGASGDKFNGGQVGSVRVFTRTGSIWSEAQKLEAGVSGAGDEFGTSVAIAEDGTTAVVGGPADEEEEGVAWVFKRSGSVWSHTEGLDSCEERTFPPGTCTKREEEEDFGYLGASVAISSTGDTILVGAPRDGQGSVWVYQKVPEGTKGVEYQRQGAKKTPTDGTGLSGYGTAVALSADGNTALVGGPGDNGGVGAAWVLTRSGFKWTQQGSKLTGAGSLPPSDFGARVALSADGDTALIGAPEEDDPTIFKEEVGSAWAFTRAEPSWTPLGGKLTGGGEQNGELTPYGGEFGSAVALSSDATTGLIGGFADHEGLGATWVFGPQGGGKEVEPKVIPPVEVPKGGSSPPAIAAAQIATALGAALVPSGKAAKIAALLKHGGFSLELNALEAGAATVQWFELPPGAKLARYARPKPVLVAAGHLSFAAAGTGVLKLKLTSAGKKILQTAKQLRLTALGTFTPSSAAAVRTTRPFLLKR